jgi:hypothetical protein
VSDAWLLWCPANSHLDESICSNASLWDRLPPTCRNRPCLAYACRVGQPAPAPPPASRLLSVESEIDATLHRSEWPSRSSSSVQRPWCSISARSTLLRLFGGGDCVSRDTFVGRECDRAEHHRPNVSIGLSVHPAQHVARLAPTRPAACRAVGDAWDCRSNSAISGG